MEGKNDNSRKHQGTQPFLHKQPARHGNGDKGRLPQQAGPAGLAFRGEKRNGAAPGRHHGQGNR